jgi:AraC-like DNA-binding protein
MQISIDPDGDWDYLAGCITLAISYLQAMLLTMVVLVFISPKVVTLRLVLSQLAVITGMDVALIGSLFLLPSRAFLYIYGLGIAVYIVMLVVYTRWYLRSYRQFRQLIADYYEDEEIEHGLRWLSTIFWVGLAVGVLAMLMLYGRRDIDMCLTVVFAVFYAFLTACFINYELSTPIILPALEKRDLPQSEPDGHQLTTEPASISLATWIQQRGYLDTQKPVGAIVKELGITTDQFHQYFQKTEGEDFRTWRVRKRVEYAQELMQEHPDWAVTRVAQDSGFNDRSWFYQQFLRFAHTSVSSYRSSLSK